MEDSRGIRDHLVQFIFINFGFVIHAGCSLTGLNVFFSQKNYFSSLFFFLNSASSCAKLGPLMSMLISPPVSLSGWFELLLVRLPTSLSEKYASPHPSSSLSVGYSCLTGLWYKVSRIFQN